MTDQLEELLEQIAPEEREPDLLDWLETRPLAAVGTAGRSASPEGAETKRPQQAEPVDDGQAHRAETVDERSTEAQRDAEDEAAARTENRTGAEENEPAPRRSWTQSDEKNGLTDKRLERETGGREERTGPALSSGDENREAVDDALFQMENWSAGRGTLFRSGNQEAGIVSAGGESWEKGGVSARSESLEAGAVSAGAENWETDAVTVRSESWETDELSRRDSGQSAAELYRQVVRAGYLASETARQPGRDTVTQQVTVGAPSLTADELDRAVRRDSRRYDGAMELY
jgi:hypothetical protein